MHFDSGLELWLLSSSVCPDVCVAFSQSKDFFLGHLYQDTKQYGNKFSDWLLQQLQIYVRICIVAPRGSNELLHLGKLCLESNTKYSWQQVKYLH